MSFRSVRIQSHVLVFVMCLTGLSGCAEEDPVLSARQFYESVTQYRQSPVPSVLEQAYSRLSQRAQDALDARVLDLNARVGEGAVKPWELLTFRGLVQGDRLADVTLLDREGDQATVQVDFAWRMPELSREAPNPIRVSMILEDGQWRVELPLPALFNAPIVSH